MSDLPGNAQPCHGATLTATRRLAAVDRARRALPRLDVSFAGWARLAARAADAPMGLVSIVGADRVYAVDEFGLPPSRWSTGQAPLTYSFCGEVIRRGQTVVIADTCADPLLADLPVVRETGARSYVGAPLCGPEGEPIGAVGVADYAVRRWPDETVAVIEDAARLICGVLADRQLLNPAEDAAAEDAPAEDFLRALLDSLDASVLACDADGRAFPNAALLDLGLPAGWSLADLADTLRVLRHPDGRPLALADAPLVRALAGEAVRGMELIAQSAGGPAHVMSVNARPIETPEGRRLGAIVVTRDVTDARRAERFHACDVELSRILARLGDLPEMATEILCCIGVAADAAHGEFWLLDRVGGDNRLVATWKPEPAPPAPPPTVPPAPPPTVPLAVPLVSDGATFGRLVLDLTDPPDDAVRELLDGIADRIAQFVQRRRAEELALELARTKDEFIALAGHTLRTPLTSIASLTELLINAGDELAAERDELLRRVRTNAETLRGIVEDLLVLAGLESGHINLSIGPLDLCQVVEEAVAALADDATRAGVRLAADLPPELPSVGDRVRLRQAVDNLLGNAVKYSPDGGTVRVRLRRKESVAELVVADEGLGIPEAERERLFNRFFRGATAHERGIPGTGLGLPLTRLIAELHGGSIALTSTGGPGTTFTLRLPLAAGAA